MRERFHILENNDPALACEKLVALGMEYLHQVGEHGREDFVRVCVLEYSLFPLVDGADIPVEGDFSKYSHEMEAFKRLAVLAPYMDYEKTALPDDFPIGGWCEHCGMGIYGDGSGCPGH